MDDNEQTDESGARSPAQPSLEELEFLYRSLTVHEREELLQCLLIAASRGASAMMEALRPWTMSAAVRRVLVEFGE